MSGFSPKNAGSNLTAAAVSAASCILYASWERATGNRAIEGSRSGAHLQHR
jgi:hypothetical protein